MSDPDAGSGPTPEWYQAELDSCRSVIAGMRAQRQPKELLRTDGLVTFTPCVKVEIKCGRASDLVGRFQEWALEQKVLTIPAGNGSGPGYYVGYFTPDDTDLVAGWLIIDDLGPKS